MRASAVSLAKHFGGLGKMYGEYRFALAPNEQKAFKGFLDQAVVKAVFAQNGDLEILCLPRRIRYAQSENQHWRERKRRKKALARQAGGLTTI